MACGACIVSTNVGGIPHLVQQERDALLVDPGRSRTDGAADRAPLSDPALAERGFRCARAKAERSTGRRPSADGTRCLDRSARNASAELPRRRASAASTERPLAPEMKLAISFDYDSPEGYRNSFGMQGWPADADQQGTDVLLAC